MTLEELQNGKVFLVDKPKEWTSFDVIRKMQGASKYRKFGHAGTLDPLATGLLIVCSGKKTKSINDYQAQEKEYEVEFVLGATTKTYDAEFEPENHMDTSQLTTDSIIRASNKQVGFIEQIPPIYSAIKVKGKRAYDLARKGKEVKLKSREVEIKKFEISDLETFEYEGFQHYRGKAKVVCSKGTYIRSLFYDLGKDLNVGGYITELRRTRIGDNLINNAQQLDDVLNLL